MHSVVQPSSVPTGEPPSSSGLGLDRFTTGWSSSFAPRSKVRALASTGRTRRTQVLS
jgi:hypothetical protein